MGSRGGSEEVLFIMNREIEKSHKFTMFGNVIYYEWRKRELKIRPMNEGRCDERLKDRVEESTCLTYTGLYDKTNYKYLEIKMRSTSEKFTNVMDENTIQTRW
jgi:hypothetical protein